MLHSLLLQLFGGVIYNHVYVKQLSGVG